MVKAVSPRFTLWRTGSTPVWPPDVEEATGCKVSVSTDVSAFWMAPPASAAMSTPPGAVTIPVPPVAADGSATRRGKVIISPSRSCASIAMPLDLLNSSAGIPTLWDTFASVSPRLATAT
eukprot:CAMPEP_0184433442 /NCGR_PEP_ID=MMETSP0738-20130409/393504_1 /TAXON_ID=385413 /ORGANISM="Thalassiosira miniscula, Strain CCMP1093" /LENGTH=119 /DNA_ID=CAMNT_0026799121 /DNA_START=126 /DNA_END=488 /DNA_ORIENTATION=-